MDESEILAENHLFRCFQIYQRYVKEYAHMPKLMRLFVINACKGHFIRHRCKYDLCKIPVCFRLSSLWYLHRDSAICREIFDYNASKARVYLIESLFLPSFIILSYRCYRLFPLIFIKRIEPIFLLSMCRPKKSNPTY